MRIFKKSSFWLIILLLISISEHLWVLKIHLFGVGINLFWSIVNIALILMILDEHQ